jgi:lysozyme family protein
MTTFDECFERLIGHEGGYVDHPGDPGGRTKFGISQRAYPGEDIKNLTLERAKTIYRRDYWGPAGCDSVPDAVRFDLFDMAVNAGVKMAVRTVQVAVGETADGVLGPRTLQALQSMPPARLLARFNGARLLALTNLPTWPAFGKGWARRIAANLAQV